MGRSEIVAPGAAHAVAFSAKSLWIVPDLWKTHRTRFPQGPWTRTERAPTRSTGPALSLERRRRRRRTTERTLAAAAMLLDTVSLT
jgi:hypothetical protein